MKKKTKILSVPLALIVLASIHPASGQEGTSAALPTILCKLNGGPRYEFSVTPFPKDQSKGYIEEGDLRYRADIAFENSGDVLRYTTTNVQQPDVSISELNTKCLDRGDCVGTHTRLSS